MIFVSTKCDQTIVEQNRLYIIHSFVQKLYKQYLRIPVKNIAKRKSTFSLPYNTTLFKISKLPSSEVGITYLKQTWFALSHLICVAKISIDVSVQTRFTNFVYLEQLLLDVGILFSVSIYRYLIIIYCVHSRRISYNIIMYYILMSLLHLEFYAFMNFIFYFPIYDYETRHKYFMPNVTGHQTRNENQPSLRISF